MPSFEVPEADDFHVVLLSGDKQKYVGLSPEPVKFRIYDDKNEVLVDDIYFEDSDLWIEVSGKQGDLLMTESPAGNTSLRQAQSSCNCFSFIWYLFPSDSPEIGDKQADSVEVYIEVFIRNTREPVDLSPIRLVHYPADS